MPNPKSRLRLWATAAAAGCAVLLGAETILHRHPHFEIERVFGFYPLLGIAAVIVLALVAGLLRGLVHREGDYYDN